MAEIIEQELERDAPHEAPAPEDRMVLPLVLDRETAERTDCGDWLVRVESHGGPLIRE